VLDRWVWAGSNALFVIGVLEQARIAERLGERQKARDSYQFVVDVWRHADPELGPYVREARGGLERLAAEGGRLESKAPGDAGLDRAADPRP
jgi:hypothetical protein